jgi:hypothetical protein
MQWTMSVLVVANITATSPELVGELIGRRERGPVKFTLVVPANPVASGREAAQLRLDEALEQLRGVGLDVEGRVGSSDPIIAVSDEWDPRTYDEIILSTLPMSVSKWLHAGLPERVERLTGARVKHVVSGPPKPEVVVGPARGHEKRGVMAPLSVLTWGAHRQP